MDITSLYGGIRPLIDGVTVSNDTRVTLLNNNDMIIGPTGAGKTGGYVIPNLMTCRGSVIVADTKGNLQRTLGPSLRARGYEIHKVDFIHPEDSDAYDPFDYIDRNERTGRLREQDVMTIARAIVTGLDSKEPFWEQSARTVTACLIAYIKDVFPAEEQNLNTLSELFRLMVHEYTDSKRANSSAPVIPFLEEYMLACPDSFVAQKYGMFKNVIAAEKTWACITQFISAAIDVFDFEEAKQMFGAPRTFRFEDLGRRKIALFLNISDTDRTLDKMADLFYTQAIQALCREADRQPDSRLRVPVRIILDDFATNAFIPDFDKVISVIRSREISVSVILQSLTQLEAMYNKPAATTIVNNCDHILYLGGHDPGTAEYISSYANMPLEKILCMPVGKACLISRGSRAVIGDRIRPYSYDTAPPAPAQDEETEATL